MAVGIDGRTSALVTGAGSGLGREVALELAQRGVSLVLVDLEPRRLADVGADVLRHTGRDVRSICVDLAARHAVDALRDVCASVAVDLLVNCAGIALHGAFADVGLDEFERVLAVDLGGTVHACAAALPGMRARRRGQIVNVGSVFGRIGAPGKSAYCAAKFALRGFTESLRAEVAADGVGVTLAVPGALVTGLVRDGASYPVAARRREQEFVARHATPLPRAARQLVAAIPRNPAVVRIGRDAVVLDRLASLAPVVARWFVGRTTRSFGCADDA